VEGKIKDAFNWKKSTKEEGLQLECAELGEDFKGTKVTVSQIEDCPLFDLNLSLEQLEFILRTKTAIGNTRCFWEEGIDIDVTLTYVDDTGKEKEKGIPFRYWPIYESDSITDESKIDFDEFVEYANRADRADHEKRRKLKNKIIYKEGTINDGNQREINYVSCYAPNRDIWRKVSHDENLCPEEPDEQWIDNRGFATFRSGIYTSVKGMPTGIITENPNTGLAGYWPNMFILFEYPNLSFDIGRKSLVGPQSRMLKKQAKNIFNKYTKYIPKYASGQTKSNKSFERDEIFSEIDEIKDLDMSGSSFEKSPKDQEASVAGMFYECVGNGQIEGIKPLVSGYKNKYDLYAKWENKNVVIEFKSKLRKIIKDFSDEQKLFSEIDAVVCWGITEDDEEEFEKLGIDIEEHKNSELGGGSDPAVPGTTHELVLPGITSPIYIIDLREIVQD
jgi:molecular chaperone HtpG